MRKPTGGENPRALLWPGLLLAAALPLVTLGNTRPADTPEERPNVVLIISDDQGWRDYGFMGHPSIRTPHLDRLASRSLRFRRGYVVAPLCRPSLASIATGLHVHRHGVTANDVSPARGLARERENRPVYERFHALPQFARILVENGYLAFQSGKWWEGSWRDGGFTHGMTHGDPQRGGRHGDDGLAIGRRGLSPITTFIDEAGRQKKPFFIWYAPFLPHAPHNPPTKLLEQYRQPERPEAVAKYFAMCEWFDQTCGELLRHIDGRGLTRNTLVLYVADNGWAPYDPKADNPPNFPSKYAPRTKGSPFEGGIRTPILLSWPNRIEAGEAQDLATSVDLLPTALRACGVVPPRGLDGIDLLDEDARAKRSTIFGAGFSYRTLRLGNPAATLQYRWCIEKDWKLLVRHHGEDTTTRRRMHQWDTTPLRLYDLAKDPHEQTNLVEQSPAVVSRLRQRLDSWWAAKQQE